MKRRIIPALASLLLSMAAPMGAQQTTLSGPMLGYVWNDADRRLHPLQGIVGNAVVGDPIDLGMEISDVLSLDGRHFVASTEGAVVIINMETTPFSIRPIPGVPSAPSRTVGSRRGSAAALYYAGDQRVLLINGFPANPTLAHSIDVSLTGEALSKLAINDNGDLLLYSTSQADRESLIGWTPMSGNRLLTTADSISAIAFSANGDAIVADSKSNEVFSIHDPGGSATRVFLADERAGVSGPVGVASSATNQIYIANAGARTILTLDSTGTVLRSHQCSCELNGIYPLKDALYRLSEKANRTIYLLETGLTGSRMAFVPALDANQ